MGTTLQNSLLIGQLGSGAAAAQMAAQGAQNFVAQGTAATATIQTTYTDSQITSAAVFKNWFAQDPQTALKALRRQARLFAPHKPPRPQHKSIVIGGRRVTRETVDRIVNKLDDARFEQTKEELFLRQYLPQLVEAGLFTRAHCKTLASYLENEPHASASEIFKSHLSLLIEKDLFPQSYFEKIANNLTRPLSTPNAYSSRYSALQFMEDLLPILLRAGWFKRIHFEKIFSNLNLTEFLLDDSISMVPSAAIDFINTHFPFLLARGWFKQSHYDTLADYLNETRPFKRKTAMDFFERQLPRLVALGWFKTEHFDRILSEICMSNRTYGHENSGKVAQKILDQYFPLLLEKKYFNERNVADLTRTLPDIFFKYFHSFKAAGLLNTQTLKNIAEYQDSLFSTPYARECGLMDEPLAQLGKNREWLASPMRWKQLLHFLKELRQDEDKRDIWENLLISMHNCNHNCNMHDYETGNSWTPEDTARFFSLMELANSHELNELSKMINHEWVDRMIGIRRLSSLQETARFLGVTEEPVYQNILARVTENEGANLLLDWALVGMDRVWEEYRWAVDLQEFKQKRKLFLNFLKQNLQRPIPCLARICNKQLEQAIAKGFETAVASGASAEETEKLALFFKKHGNQFRSSGLYRLFIKASRFMEPKGIASMRRLLLGLQIEKGRLVYPRFEELRGVVSEELLEKYSKEYAVTPFDLAALDDKQGKEAMHAQTLAQVEEHIKLPATVDWNKVPESLRALPQQVQTWLANLSLEEGKNLQSIFESHYAAIREHFGDTFANIRIDLRNFVAGAERGVKVAKKSERFVVKVDIESIARSGSEPVSTCQTLESAYINEEGQPIHRMLHGQFNVANWEIDGIVMARRLIEITVDEKGTEHLLVERLYIAGGFARVKEMDASIMEYALYLGIDASRVHFDTKNAPAPLQTGDIIYRDTFREEGMTLEEVKTMRAGKKRVKKSNPSRSHKPIDTQHSFS